MVQGSLFDPFLVPLLEASKIVNASKTVPKSDHFGGSGGLAWSVVVCGGVLQLQRGLWWYRVPFLIPFWYRFWKLAR